MSPISIATPCDNDCFHLNEDKTQLVIKPDAYLRADTDCPRWSVLCDPPNLTAEENASILTRNLYIEYDRQVPTLPVFPIAAVVLQAPSVSARKAIGSKVTIGFPRSLFEDLWNRVNRHVFPPGCRHIDSGRNICETLKDDDVVPDLQYDDGHYWLQAETVDSLKGSIQGGRQTTPKEILVINALLAAKRNFYCDAVFALELERRKIADGGCTPWRLNVSVKHVAI
ncbi:unnamed protein product [Sympodiomycopsis kandeliae]